MQEWYLPITFLPAIGLFIMSNANLIIALNEEIDLLKVRKDVSTRLVNLKLSQLARLTRSMVFFYISAVMLAIAGLSSAIPVLNEEWKEALGKGFMYGGVLASIIALFILVQYSRKAVKIRIIQHRDSLD